MLVAPTGKAVDVAIREGAGDTGYTIAKALQSLRDETLKLSHLDLVVVDEAGMVGTDDLRQLLTATTERRDQDRAGRRRPSAGPGQSPGRHVRPTLHRPALDPELVGGVADARSRGAGRVAGAAGRWAGPGPPRRRVVSRP